MHVYDTLIIGCGYSSIGYATACPSTVICEEHQICDTGFYLPMRSFRYSHYSPETEEGKRLYGIFSSLNLFGENEQNTNGFEFAICKYIYEKQLNVLLKCRVIRIDRQPSGLYDVTVHSNEGLTHLFAKKILDTTNEPTKKRFTILFVCKDIESVKEKLFSAFEGAEIETAFYPDRYALHIWAGNADENRIKLEVYEKWKASDTRAKILFMAPVFYGDADKEGLSDLNYANPIEAFEGGYFYARETDR